MNRKKFYHGKTILITGAASGIGKRFAEKISQFAHTTLILWDRNPNLLEEIKEDLTKKAKLHITGIDISDSVHIQLEAERLIKQELVPNIIVNCAGIVVGKFFHEHNPVEIEQTLQINTAGSMYVAHAFLDAMIERGSGHIVNLASASGYIGNPRMSVYAASKWAVLGWSESLRLEMEKLNTGIHITTVIPSYINTGMFDGVKAPRFVPILETEDLVDQMISGIAKSKNEIKTPFMVRFVPFLKSVLPPKAFDRLAGNLLGVYSSMDTFKGRTSKKS